MVLLIATTATAYAVYSLRKHEANNTTEYDPERLRGWRLAATVALVCQIAMAVWLASTGNLM